MKKFKDILREFRGNIPDDMGENDDPYKRIEEFMRKTPFTHVLTGEHTLHFNDSLNAAKLIADKRENHEHGLGYAGDIGDEKMSQYFAASAGTHDDVIDALERHITNHPKLPNDLRPHVKDTINDIERISKARAKISNNLSFMSGDHPTRNKIGKTMYDQHIPIEDDSIATEERHPNLFDDEHHLRSIIDVVRKDPDQGYYLQKKEYKD